MIASDTAAPLAGLAAELQRQLETKRDLMADTRRISLGEAADGGTSLLVDLPDGVSEFAVTRHTHGQIADHLGVPFRLYERLLNEYPDLLGNLANGLLAREPSKRLLRTMDGTARAFLSDRYRPRDNWDLLDTAVLPVLEELPALVEVVKCDLTETRMYVKLMLPEIAVQVTPKVGDVIRGGIIIQNSEVGSGALGVFPYSDRLICTNGMVHTDYGQRRIHVGGRAQDDRDAYEFYSDATLALDDAAFFAKVSDTVRSVLNQTVFEAIAAQMRDLAGIPVAAAPDHVIEVFATRHGLNESERGSMLKNLIEGGDTSAWGYTNALTATARDLDDADRQVELQALGGRLVSNPNQPEWALAAA